MIGESARTVAGAATRKTGSNARCADTCPRTLFEVVVPGGWLARQEPTSVAGSSTVSPGTSLAEQVRHYVGVVIAGMIQAGQLECGFERLQQGEVSIEVRAYDTAVVAVIGVDDDHDLVDVGCKAVVVLVPH